MGMFDSLNVSASGMTATQLWMDVISSNLANADSTKSANGAMQVDGNTVDINTENADLSENTLDYQALESVMGTRMSILKTAIGSTS